MMLRRVNAAATGAAQNHRTAQTAPRAVAQTGSLIHQLVDGRVDKSGELDFSDRPKVLCGEPDGNPRDGRFGEWGVSHPAGPEALEQIDGCLEHSAVGGHIFAKQYD